MFQSLEIDIKLCQNYTKIYIYMKKSENDYIPQKSENLRFAPIITF